jgi:hypothetical protein
MYQATYVRMQLKLTGQDRLAVSFTKAILRRNISQNLYKKVYITASNEHHGDAAGELYWCLKRRLKSELEKI